MYEVVAQTQSQQASIIHCYTQSRFTQELPLERSQKALK